MTRVIAIRPEPGCTATASLARDIGLKVETHPLSQVVAIEWHMPPGSFDGILAGSANAFRYGGPLVDNLVDLPVYAVGERTAAAAWERGLRTAVIGVGGLQEVLDELAGQRLRLLRICGANHTALDPPDGIELVSVLAYGVEPQRASTALAELLRQQPIVLLHSAGAAQHVAEELDRLSIDRASIRLVALGPRIAAAVGEGWGAVRAAEEPNDPALLALARDLCHEPFRG